MATEYFIAMDTHCHSTDICVKTRANGPGRRWKVPTTIPAIREVLEQVKHPRKLTLEEGPLAGWLLRNLKGDVDEAWACDPRRNALIAKDGDKDDPIDAAKLADLFIGGFLRKVHHPESLAREVAKQTAGLYHERVEQRVRCVNKVLGHLRGWGVVVREKDLAEGPPRQAVLAALGSGPEAAVVRGHVDLLLGSYDEACRQEEVLRREVRKLAKAEEQVGRWQALPGIGPIRGLTLLVYLDTPWRFKSKAALWKYLGIGLVRSHSGEGQEYLHVEHHVHRVLKGTILGAAESAILQGDNVFAQQHRAWVAAGLSPRNARRNVARSQAAVLWGMWKSGGEFDPTLVGLAQAQGT